MVDQSELKSISRDQLLSRSSSSEPGGPDAALEAQLREQLKLKFGDEIRRGPVIEGIADVQPRHHFNEAFVNGAEDTYEFRLFAKPAESGASKDESQGLQRIALRSPTPTNAESGFITPQRPERHYFTGVTSAGEVDQFRRAAVSGEQVREGLKQRWPGLQMPWRVTVIRSSDSSRVAGAGTVPEEATVKGKRSGKKRRIIIRKRLEAKAAIKMAAHASQAERDAADKEKRTRRNREKKVKKRQKDKLKKSQENPDTG